MRFRHDGCMSHLSSSIAPGISLKIFLYFSKLAEILSLREQTYFPAKYLNYLGSGNLINVTY